MWRIHHMDLPPRKYHKWKKVSVVLHEKGGTASNAATGVTDRSLPRGTAIPPEKPFSGQNIIWHSHQGITIYGSSSPSKWADLKGHASYPENWNWCPNSTATGC